jgi:hypothetical protein
MLLTSSSSLTFRILSIASSTACSASSRSTEKVISYEL